MCKCGRKKLISPFQIQNLLSIRRYHDENERSGHREKIFKNQSWEILVFRLHEIKGKKLFENRGKILEEVLYNGWYTNI